tara:strand:+ start:23 stop:490 length:468 start_codon:yes stop_codon:yes gene_type:complete
MSDDGSEEEVGANPYEELWPEFEPNYEMKSSRLNDIVENLSTKELSVLNLDATLPPGEGATEVLQTILFMLTKSVKTLSLRFNMLPPEACQMLVEWSTVNDTVEMLYLNMTHMDEKYRSQIEANWKKKLTSGRTENQGWTFIRCPEPEAPPPEEE